MTPERIAELRERYADTYAPWRLAETGDDIDEMLDEIERLRDPLTNVLGRTLDERQSLYVDWKQFAALLIKACPSDEAFDDLVLGESRHYLGVALTMALNEIERHHRQCEPDGPTRRRTTTTHITDAEETP